MLSLLDLAAGESDLNALLLLIDADVLCRTGRLGLELRRTENGRLEDEGRRGVQGQVRDRLVDGDGDLSRASEGECLEIGTDRQVVVDRAAKRFREAVPPRQSPLFEPASKSGSVCPYVTSVPSRASAWSAAVVEAIFATESTLASRDEVWWMQ